MSYKDPTYVIFDGDEDAWAYRFMRGWRQNERIDFDFEDAHDLDNMTSRAQDEAYVKGKLRPRMQNSAVALVLVGEKTRNLYRFVRWEMELALELGLAVVVANLNEKRSMDRDRCPPILRDATAVHVAFKMRIIKYALDSWPAEFRRLRSDSGARYYSDEVYKSLGL